MINMTEAIQRHVVLREESLGELENLRLIEDGCAQHSFCVGRRPDGGVVK